MLVIRCSSALTAFYILPRHSPSGNHAGVAKVGFECPDRIPPLSFLTLRLNSLRSVQNDDGTALGPMEPGVLGELGSWGLYYIGS